MKTMTSTLKKVAAVGAMLLAAQSWAYSVGGVDVGGTDSFVDFADASSSFFPPFNPANEEAWAESLLLIDLSLSEAGGTQSYQMVDGAPSTVYAFQLDTAPAYFILKNSTYEMLFANISNMDWAVFDIGLLPGGANISGTGTISHVTEFNGTTSVPDPGTVSLLAAGLLGLAATRRYAKKA